MVKTTAPALSFGAQGAIAKTMVYSKWRGISYARQHVIPSNPNTTAQQATRSVFALMREMWKIAPAGLQAPWDAFAYGRPFTGFNKFIGENVRVLKDAEDFTDFIGSPGARGGLPPDSVTVSTPAAGSIKVVAVAPTMPDGWTLTSLDAVCFRDQDPHGIFEGTIAFLSVANPATGVTFTGLTAAQEYVTAAFLKMLKPDGKEAFSVGVTTLKTAT